MNLELKGKRALVTGSTTGAGLAIARLLAAEGASVVINGRTPERVDAALRTLRMEVPGADVQGVAADLSSATLSHELISRVPDVDILINNLDIRARAPFERMTDGEWFRVFETNVMSGVRMSRAYLPRMRRRDWGRIVFISGESGLQHPVAQGFAAATAGSGVLVHSIAKQRFTTPDQVAAMVYDVCVEGRVRAIA